MSDLGDAIRREIDSYHVRHADDPVRIRITRAAVPGTILIMPEDASTFAVGAVTRRREIRIHPDDWNPLLLEARERVGAAGARFTEMFGIPVLTEQDCLPEDSA